MALPLMVIDELRQHRLRQTEALLRIGVRLTDSVTLEEYAKQKLRY